MYKRKAKRGKQLVSLAVDDDEDVMKPENSSLTTTNKPQNDSEQTIPYIDISLKPKSDSNILKQTDERKKNSSSGILKERTPDNSLSKENFIQKESMEINKRDKNDNVFLGHNLVLNVGTDDIYEKVLPEPLPKKNKNTCHMPPTSPEDIFVHDSPTKKRKTTYAKQSIIKNLPEALGRSMEIFNKQDRNDGIFSAPNSVLNVVKDDVYENPLSEPLPMNFKNTLSDTPSHLSEANSAINSPTKKRIIVEESTSLLIEDESNLRDSSAATSPVPEPYLGCAPLSPDECFSHSSSSWIPNSDEEAQLSHYLGSKRRLRHKSDNDSSIEDIVLNSGEKTSNETEKSLHKSNSDQKNDDSAILIFNSELNFLIEKQTILSTNEDYIILDERTGNFSSPSSMPSHFVLDERTGFMKEVPENTRNDFKFIVRSSSPLSENEEISSKEQYISVDIHCEPSLKKNTRSAIRSPPALSVIALKYLNKITTPNIITEQNMKEISIKNYESDFTSEYSISVEVVENSDKNVDAIKPFETCNEQLIHPIPDLTNNFDSIEPYVEESNACKGSSKDQQYTLPINQNAENSNQHDITRDRPSEGNTRWRKRAKNTWKRNVEKEYKYSGLPYFNRTGKLMSAKEPKPVNCNCKFQCKSFSDDDRSNVCKEYWGLKNYKLQKEYIVRHVDILPVKRVKASLAPEKRRKASRNYYFYKNDNKLRVCMSFFTKTLSISNGPINEATSHVSEQGHYNGTDNRGKGNPKNKTSDEELDEVRNHIKSFPVMESHYCKKKSSRLYLESSLSIMKMYELYKEIQEQKGKRYVKLSVYRNTFCTEFNYAFFKPRKDQCLTCTRYGKNKEPSLKEEYDQHILRKNSAKEAKAADNQRAAEDDRVMCATVDMQSVLQIPSSDVGLLYYSRKLNVQNFTIYESKPPNNAYCIVWNEINGKRGSNEIATALKWYFDQLPEQIVEVILYSDTCAGQNRNQFIAAFLSYMVQVTNLQIIEQKYLESGHSTMEVDSMHSAIEKEKKHTAVYSMIDWKNIMVKARSKRHRRDAPPYVVKELSYDDIIDVKTLNENTIQNKSVDNNGAKINWLKIKNLRFEKFNPGVIKFRYDHEGPYMWFDTKNQGSGKTVGRKTRKSKSITTSNSMTAAADYNLEKAYENPLPISKLKKRDLLELCKKGIIPSELRSWYENLPCADMVEAERLPNITENEEEC